MAQAGSKSFQLVQLFANRGGDGSSPRRVRLEGCGDEPSPPRSENIQTPEFAGLERPRTGSLERRPYIGARPLPADAGAPLSLTLGADVFLDYLVYYCMFVGSAGDEPAY
jgi:hypothetical protein